MNNKDLIKREDVVSFLDTFIAEYGKALLAAIGDIEESMSAKELASIVTDTVVNIRSVVKAIHAVPQEMSAVEYLKERNRMESWGAENCNRASFDCDDWCCECPYDQAPSCADEANRPLEAIAIIEKWAREHPERSEDNAKV